MVLNVDKTIRSALTRSHSWTFAKYTNNNMPTWMTENSQEREKIYGREKRSIYQKRMAQLLNVHAMSGRLIFSMYITTVPLV